MKKHTARCEHHKDGPDSCTVGIDVSKQHLDACELPSGREARFSNTKEGVRAFGAWACPRVTRVVYESTGSYHLLLEDLLVDRLPLSRINPKRGKRFAEALGSEAKTDRADALVLAKMGRAMADDLMETPVRTRREKDLDELRAARDAVNKALTVLKGRREHARNRLVRREIEKDIARAKRQIGRLDQELDRQRLEAQADRLKQQLERSRQQIEIQQRRLKMASEQLERYSGLRDKGYFSKVRYQEELDLVLNHEQTVQSMLQERIAMTSNLANLHSELAKLPAIHLEQLADIDRHLAVLRGQSAEVDASNVLQYRSPVTGTVTGLQIQPGVTVRPNLPLVSILPANSQIYAQLHVPTRAAGFLNVGQPVKIRYAAFPHQRYGSYLGEVTHIARTILFPNELGMTVPLNEPVYQVHVALAEFSILGYGQRWPLQVGMQLEADIVLDERRFLDWLLDPILSLRGKLA